MADVLGMLNVNAVSASLPPPVKRSRTSYTYEDILQYLFMTAVDATGCDVFRVVPGVWYQVRIYSSSRSICYKDALEIQR